MDAAGKLRHLTAQQAAARLGVKVETLYAYVSRGVIERVPGPDGRTSRFDARAVERLAAKGRSSGVRPGGLSVVLGTALTLIEQDRLGYRGLDATRLATTAPFEDVAEWLWLGEVSPAEAAASQAWQPWRAPGESLRAARNALRELPVGTPSADLLRVVATLVGPTDPLRFDLSERGIAGSARRLVAALVDALPSCSSQVAAPLVQGAREPLADALAQRLWERLTVEPGTAPRVGLLNALLVLVADHGLAASTLAARVAASVRADPCSVVATGLGTLAGPLHGAASAPVHQLFDEVERPDRAIAVIGDFLRRQRHIPGFGHVIYRDWDPRARVLRDLIVRSDLESARIEVIERVLEILLDRVDVRPNVDFFIGALTWAAHMSDGAGEAIFGVARSAGWVAHAIEEYEEPALRFRPRAHYVGPATGAVGPAAGAVGPAAGAVGPAAGEARRAKVANTGVPHESD